MNWCRPGMELVTRGFSRGLRSCFAFFLIFVVSCLGPVIPGLYATSLTELGVEGNLTVLGIGPTLAYDPDVEIKGFTVFGSTQTAYTGSVMGPGNVVINGYLYVSSGAYFVGGSTFAAGGAYFTGVSSFSDVNNIYIAGGTANQVLATKGPTGSLTWTSGSSFGDNLGNHIATTILQMGGYQVTGTGALTMSSATLTNTAGAGLVVSSSAYLAVSGGLVGIGTTSPAYPLDVTGSAKISTYLGVGINPNTSYSIAVPASGITIGSGGALDFGSGNSRIRDGSNGYYMAFQTWDGAALTEKVRIKGNGNVGVGTTTPNSKFEVAGGSITISGADANLVIGGNAGRYVSDDSSNYRTVFSSNVYIVGYSSAAKYYGDGSSLTGLGGTLSGGQTPLLPYWTAANALGNSNLSRDSATSLTAVGSTFTVQGNAFSVGGSIFVVANGNVGIGTTAPNYKLEVQTTDGVIHAGFGNPATGGWIAMKPDGINGNVIRVGGIGALSGTLRILSSGDSEKMRIEGGGNVGISTGAPQARLDLLAGGATAADMAQIWRDSNGTIQSSMSATGVMMAKQFIGNGAGLTNLNLTGAGDNLGNHTATKNLDMNTFNIVNVGSITANAAITTYSSMTVAGNGGQYGLQVSSGVNLAGLIYTNNGNVGIGTTSPLALLQITSAVTNDTVLKLTGTGSADAYLNFAAPNIGGQSNYPAFLRWTRNNGQGRMFGIYTTSDGAASNLALYADAAGNVGIGTTAPSSKFEVSGGSITISGANANLVIGGNAGRYVSDDSSNYRTVFSSNVYIVGYSSAVKYYGDGSSLTGLGGTLSGGQTPLLPYWTAANTLGNSNLSRDSATSLTAVGSTFTVQGNAFSVGGSTFVVTNGNVGIGTTGATGVLTYKTEIYGADPVLGLSGTANGVGQLVGLEFNQQTTSAGATRAGGAIKSVAAGVYTGGVGSTYNSDLALYTSASGVNTERIRILSGGNVGIGTTAPTTKLHVSSGVLTVDGAGGGITTTSSMTFTGANGSGYINASTTAALGGGLTISTNVYIVGFSSASKYYGDGSNLTNLNLTGAGDNLGNHTATKTLDMNTFNIVNVGSITANAAITTYSSMTVAGNGGQYGLQVSSGVNLAGLIYTNNGKVGVGTTAPLANLHVHTGIDQNIFATAGPLYNGVDGITLASVNDANNGYRDLNIVAKNIILNGAASTFNVGIGTMTPAAKLDVNGNVIFQAGTVRIAPAADVAGNAVLVIKDEGSDGTLDIASEINGTAGANSNPITFRVSNVTPNAARFEAMRITNAGNVGIGTTAPNSKFEVSGGSITISGANANLVIGGNAGRYVSDDSSNYRTVFSSNVYIAGYSSATYYYGNGSLLTGIGGTLSGGQTPLLPYWTAANALGNSNLSRDSATSLTAVGSTFTVQGNAFSVGGSTFVVTNGYVGIGKTIPSYNLHVLGAFQEWSASFGSGSATPPWLNVGTVGGIPALQGYTNAYDASSNIVLQPYGVGSVGIGTTSPGAKLEVNGQVKITGGGPGLGKVLTSDGVGLASWQSTVPGDNLGNHIATTTLQMGGYQITGTGALTMSSATLTNTAGAGLVVSSSAYLAVSGGNVGIGTTAPAYKLEVQDTGALAFQVKPEAGYISLWVSGVEVARMRK